ncbi:MAG: glycoside hydrolase domain-containing protein [Sedimentisphaerales bacterium]
MKLQNSLIFGIVLYCLSPALSYEGLIFYAPFENSVAPIIAAGDSLPNIIKGKKSEFVKGIVGNAIVTGVGYGVPSYVVKDNLCDIEGSLSLWIKPIDWSPFSGDRRVRAYMQIPGRMVLEWYGPSVWTAFLWMDGNKVVWGNAGYDGGGIEKGQWGHLAFTWGKDGCVMYYNGKFLRRTDGNLKGMYSEDELSEKETGRLKRWDYKDARFYLGEDGSETAFDELMIFNRELSPAEILSLYRRGSRKLSDLEFSVPLVKESPLINKEFNKSAWEKASGVTAFIDRMGEITNKAISAHFFASSENLYLLIKSKGGLPCKENYAEIRLGKQEDFVNSAKYIFKIKADSEKSSQPNDIQWQAGHFVVDGEDFFAVAIPFKVIGFDVNSNQQLGINVIRNWSDKYLDWASLTDTTSKGISAYAKINFVKDGTVFNLKSVGDLQYASLGIQGNFHNFSDANDDVNILIELKPKDLQEFVDKAYIKTYSGTLLASTVNLSVLSGSSDYNFSKQITDTDTDSVFIDVTKKNGDKVYSQHIPFICTPAMLVNAETYPKHDRVDVVLDTTEYRAEIPDNLAVELSFMDGNNKKVGYTEVNPLKGTKTRASYQLSKLPDGNIKVDALLKTREGEKVFNCTTAFKKIPPGPWYQNKLGLDDVVIPPFTPIKVDGQKVSVWNRTYVWKDSLFPVEIYTDGVNILGAPIELYTSEIPTGNPNKAVVIFKKKSDTTVVLEAEGEIGGVPVTVKTTIEYDGMLYFELIFKPLGNTVLPHLAMVSPMKAKEAWLYHYFANAGAVNETENRRGEPFKGDAQIPWYNNIWLGTADHGLAWWAISNENWKLQDNPKPFRIHQNAGVTNFTTTIAKSEYVIKKDMKISFGFIATPVKPMRDNWRFFRKGRDWTYSWFFPMMNSNNHIGKMEPGFPEYVKSMHEKVPLYVAYAMPCWMNFAEEELPYYRQEWQSDPWKLSGTDTGGISGENRHLEVCLGSDWQDYLLYNEIQIMDKSGGDGFYHDMAHPIDCKNENHGHGYMGNDGKRYFTNAILDYRQYYKRLAVEMNKRKSSWQGYLIWLHQSNLFAVPAFSFANMGWDGEQFSYSFPAIQDYTKLLTPEAFLAEWHGKQFGYPVQWLLECFSLDKEKPAGPNEIDTALCFSLITGTQELMLTGHLSESLLEYATRVVDRADEFGLSKGRADFLGWWENDNYIKLEPENKTLKCSLWKAKGKVLLMFGNANGNKNKPVETVISLNRKNIGLTGTLLATDWFTGEKLDINNDVLKIQVKGSSWRMIAVKSED